MIAYADPRYLLSIDPGLASGFSLWEYSETEPARMVDGEQTVSGGYYSFINGLYEYHNWLEYPTSAEVITEKWIPYPTPGHSPTLDSTYPLVLEGVLVERGLMPVEYPHERWRRSGAQYWVPTHENGKKLKVAERRKRQLAWLKESTDLYRTPTQMGVKHKDCQDYHSSVFHALSWFRHIDHRSTIEHYWGNDEPR